MGILISCRVRSLCICFGREYSRVRSTVWVLHPSPACKSRLSPAGVFSSTALTLENMSEIGHIAQLVLFVCLRSSSLILGLINLLGAGISWYYCMCYVQGWRLKVMKI